MPTKPISYSYVCDAYEKSLRFHNAEVKGATIEEQCSTCKFLMFGQCWLLEFNQDDKTVHRAIEGSQSALIELQKRLEA